MRRKRFVTVDAFVEHRGSRVRWGLPVDVEHGCKAKLEIDGSIVIFDSGGRPRAWLDTPLVLDENDVPQPSWYTIERSARVVQHVDVRCATWPLRVVRGIGAGEVLAAPVQTEY